MVVEQQHRDSRRNHQMNLKDAVDGFIAGYFSTCRRSPKTHAAYAIDLAQFIAFAGADQLVASIDAELLERWAKELHSRAYASVSIRRKFATARVFFAYW